MKFELIIAVLFLGIPSACSKKNNQTQVDEIEFASANLDFDKTEIANAEQIRAQAIGLNTFSTQLFGKLKQSKLLLESENMVFSPFSVRLALSMLLSGAQRDGTVQNEIKNSLGLGSSEEVSNLGVKSQLLSLQDSFDRTIAKKGAYSIVNQLFVEKSSELNPDYLATLKRTYNAGVGRLNFKSSPNESKDIINRFVSKKTNSLIEKLVPENSITKLTRAVLLNTLYMKIEWNNTFEKLMTREETFTTADGQTRTVPMMNQTEALPYYSADKFAAVGKPFKNGALQMVFLLPKSGTTLSQLESELTSERIQSVFENPSIELVDLTLPKFKIQWGTKSLKDPLKALGLKEGFENKGNFPRILKNNNEDLNIDDVLHQAVVEVDERGTEAAAATTVVVAVPTSARINIDKPIAFRIDQPALFFIIESSSKSIVFMGRLGDPSR